MLVYQQIDNYVLQPTIIGRAARVSGFTVLASVLAFGALFGVIGAIIGVPIAGGLQILLEELTAGRRARVAAADVARQQQSPDCINHAKRVTTAHTCRGWSTAAHRAPSVPVGGPPTVRPIMTLYPSRSAPAGGGQSHERTFVTPRCRTATC
jgi:AI-2E family transporter